MSVLERVQQYGATVDEALLNFVDLVADGKTVDGEEKQLLCQLADINEWEFQRLIVFAKERRQGWPFSPAPTAENPPSSDHEWPAEQADAAFYQTIGGAEPPSIMGKAQKRSNRPFWLWTPKKVIEEDYPKKLGDDPEKLYREYVEHAANGGSVNVAYATELCIATYTPYWAFVAEVNNIIRGRHGGDDKLPRRINFAIEQDSNQSGS